MNTQTPFEGLDPEILERLASRRDVLKSGGKLTAGWALAAVPFAIAATAKSAFADHLPAAVVDVLNYALTLEYLEAEFYTLGLAASGLIPATSTINGDAFLDRKIFQTIQEHEVAHVDFLRKALGHNAVAKPNFDFTAGGAFAPFTDYNQFKLLAQAFEDTGVRAYKGRVPDLIPFDPILTAAATIHSVEARHASEVRRLRGLKGWIPFDQPGVPDAVKPVYAGEAMLNLPVNAVSGMGVTEEQVTEAFDEPLTVAQVLAIVRPFIRA